MSWLSSILIAALAGVLGLVVAGLISSTFVDWFHISSREGESGYFIVFSALLGGAAACALGFVLSRAVPVVANAKFFPALGMCCGAVLALGAVVLLVAWLRTDFAPTLDGKSLEVAIEVRCPKGFVLPKELDEYGAFAAVQVPGSGSYQPQGKLDLAGARQEGGQWIVSAVVPLETSSANKLMDVRFSQAASLTFGFPLRPRPASSDLEWSAWVDSGWDLGKPEPHREQKFSLRYKVRLVVPKAVVDAAAEPVEDTKFASLGAETPIVEWFPYTHYGAQEEHRQIAVKFITARPKYAAELTALMLDADDDVAKEALYLVGYLPPQPALSAGVAACGRDIAARIKKFNATPVEADPGYVGAASVSVRFSAWMEAVRTLREKSGGDFTGELRPILELSRVRADSVVMRGDVCRVASYYMKEWAGLAPAAGDPPPR